MIGGVIKGGVKKKSTELTCQNCQKKGSIELVSYNEFFHLIFIPFLSVGKTVCSQCQSCKEVLLHHEMPHKLKLEATALKRQTKMPFWHFTGVILLLLFPLYFMFESKSDVKENILAQRELEQSYIASPFIGDVYKYRIDKNTYTTFRVNAISNDSIFMVKNIYTAYNINGLREIKKIGIYENTPTSMPLKELSQLYEERIIFDIIRSKSNALK